MWADDGADGVLPRGLSGVPGGPGVSAHTRWRAVVAENATAVVVGSESQAERLHEGLNERGVGHVTVRSRPV